MIIASLKKDDHLPLFTSAFSVLSSFTFPMERWNHWDHFQSCQLQRCGNRPIRQAYGWGLRAFSNRGSKYRLPSCVQEHLPLWFPITTPPSTTRKPELVPALFQAGVSWQEQATEMQSCIHEGLALGFWIWKSWEYFGKDGTRPPERSQQKPSRKLQGEHGGTWMISSLSRWTRRHLFWDTRWAHGPSNAVRTVLVGRPGRTHWHLRFIFTQPLPKLLSGRPSASVSCFICGPLAQTA